MNVLASQMLKEQRGPSVNKQRSSPNTSSQQYYSDPTGRRLDNTSHTDATKSKEEQR